MSVNVFQNPVLRAAWIYWNSELWKFNFAGSVNIMPTHKKEIHANMFKKIFNLLLKLFESILKFFNFRKFSLVLWTNLTSVQNFSKAS